MLITDARAGERFTESGAIVLGIGTRARHGPHVDDHFDFGASQQGDEFLDWARRMANREDWFSDGRLLNVNPHSGGGEFSRRFAVELLIGDSHIMNVEESTQ